MYRRLISVKQTAELLNLSVISVYRMVKDGRIGAKKLGRRVLVDPETIGISEIPEKPKIEKAPKPQMEEGKSPLKSILKDLIPELELAFKFVPDFGDVGFRVVFHNSQVARVETTTSVSKLVSKNGKN